MGRLKLLEKLEKPLYVSFSNSISENRIFQILFEIFERDSFRENWLFLHCSYHSNDTYGSTKDLNIRNAVLVVGIVIYSKNSYLDVS